MNMHNASVIKKESKMSEGGEKTISAATWFYANS